LVFGGLTEEFELGIGELEGKFDELVAKMNPRQGSTEQH
jgi:hypothetical protein